MTHDLNQSMTISLRVLAATFGGYALANLGAVALGLLGTGGGFLFWCGVLSLVGTAVVLLVAYQPAWLMPTVWWALLGGMVTAVVG